VATLFTSNPTGKVNGVLKEGTISSTNLMGPLEGKTITELVDMMKNNKVYVNVHSTDFPDGEIRGTVGHQNIGLALAGKVTSEQCVDNGNIAPCIDEDGTTVYYCDDPRVKTAGAGAACLPSPQEWTNFLPECNSVNFESSCSGPQGPYFTCDDPEFHVEKYPYGCLENGKLTKS
jgi:hypothetical protein